MKIYNDANILNLIEQIREVNHLIELHKLSSDDFMLNQYKARKNDFLKELVFELICLDINTNEIYQLVRNLINKIENNTPKVEPQTVYQDLHFSIKELETVTN
jgi:signal recognition particle GTPase